MRNSRIILCSGINLDREYINVLNYTEQQMLNLCLAHKVAEVSNYSFIRQNRDSLRTSFTYSQVLNSNYIAFQNSDYDNKWFFAFIDDVIYRGDKCTEIVYTVDSWSTWFNKLTIKPCFVKRHHVNDDVVGRYTLPENIETGDFVINETIKVNEMTTCSFIIQTMAWTTNTDNPVAMNYGGIYYSGGAYICPDIVTTISIINALKHVAEDTGVDISDIIKCVYMCPTSFILNTSGTLQYSGQNSPALITKKIDKPTTVGNYTPKNNRLLCYPYVFLNLSNNNGSTNTYKYEHFNDFDVNVNKCVFDIVGVPTVGANSKCIPINYKNATEEYNENEGIVGGKFPTLSWSDDAYINWLTQESVNIQNGVVSTITPLALGFLSGNIGGGIATSSASLLSTLLPLEQHELAPNTSRGNTNGGDINTSNGTNTFYFYKMCIKEEYARICDDYFNKFGYKISRVITPNITGRPYWNYVEIGESEEIGFGTIPMLHMETINKACRKGVTIWHNHDNIGNYNLDNTIVSQET